VKRFVEFWGDIGSNNHEMNQQIGFHNRKISFGKNFNRYTKGKSKQSAKKHDTISYQEMIIPSVSLLYSYQELIVPG